MDESYTLDIHADKIRLTARTIFGAMRGLETLLQLLQPHGHMFAFPSVHIEDAPRFPWRGLLLDSSRHFLPIDVIFRTLDGMAAVKLNVLHWHLTDDQGFRVESRVYPLLHQHGSNGLYYTQDQIREVIRYAAECGIRVVPEFDMPGHSTSWFTGYPSLASAPGPYRIEYQNRIVDAAMDPTSENTYRFLDRFIAEMTTLFPDEYLHIGGDEVNGKQWNANSAIQRFMEAHHLQDNAALQAYFNQRVEAILRKHHRSMVGWDEILHSTLSPGVVVQNWHGIKFLIDSARQGHNTLLSEPFYLDHMYSAADMYAADPLPKQADLTTAQAHLILGGEVCMWGEHVNDLTIDSRIWPRAAAVAERLWSPASTRDATDMYRRLAVMSLRLDGLGIHQISGPERGLRQLAGSQAAANQLAIFASVLQPVDFSERKAEQQTSQRTPIDNLVDFVRPDPPIKEHFATLVSTYLASLSGPTHDQARVELESLFQQWIDSRSSLEELTTERPLLFAVHTRAQQLPELGELGLTALHSIEVHQPESSAWLADQQSMLAASAKHLGLTDFVILDPLRSLLDKVPIN
jgi:hexosaminidase